MKRLCYSFGFVGLLLASTAFAENWPQFRGPEGNGHSGAQGLPLTWSETQNVKWKTPIHGRAWSSPVIWADQIWLTTATEDGRQLFAVCLDRNSGKIVHDLKLFEVANPQFAHKFNSYGSPTPVIEEGRVYVTFGSPGTACLDTKTGKVLWERRDFVCNHFRGAGSSPIIFQNLLFMNFDGSDHQFIAALDKNTGKTVWRKERSVDYKDLGPDGKPEAEGDWRKSYATPHIAMFNGKPVLLSSGAKAHYGYEPLTGNELWRVEERSCHSAASRPVIGDGLIFIPAGFSKGLLLAIRPPGGESREHSVVDAAKVTAANPTVSSPSGLQVAWKSTRNAPNKPSILLVRDLLFMIDDAGIASCLEAKTGAEVWRERVGGNYSASPVEADGRIYFVSEEGKTTVVEASRQFKVLAENKLDDGFMASPAISGKALYLRTKTHLYRIEQ
jgi:outer membrane protein assembly factor BamB